jgi:hypothetical protein
MGTIRNNLLKLHFSMHLIEIHINRYNINHSNKYTIQELSAFFKQIFFYVKVVISLIQKVKSSKVWLIQLQ